MKISAFQKTGFALAAAFVGATFAINVFGQTTPPPPTPMFNDIPAPASTPIATANQPTPPPAPVAVPTPPPLTPGTPTTAAPPLSPAAAQILQLAQARISDSTIVAFIQNSSTMYGLNADQVIYLKQQGVSDGVINAMLNQSSRVAASIAQTAPQNYGQNSAPDQSTAVVQPTTPAPSAVYVVPDSQTAAYNSWAVQYVNPWPVSVSVVGPWWGWPVGWGWRGGVWCGPGFRPGFGPGFRGGVVVGGSFRGGVGFGGGFRGGFHR